MGIVEDYLIKRTTTEKISFSRKIAEIHKKRYSKMFPHSKFEIVPFEQKKVLSFLRKPPKKYIAYALEMTTPKKKTFKWKEW